MDNNYSVKDIPFDISFQDLPPKSKVVQVLGIIVCCIGLVGSLWALYQMFAGGAVMLRSYNMMDFLVANPRYVLMLTGPITILGAFIFVLSSHKKDQEAIRRVNELLGIENNELSDGRKIRLIGIGEQRYRVSFQNQ
ncbi:hypothetical protein [Kangiella shandongensis]|uniref:hypothetical protein n=1 Tax=Kangiella shandongensis TaxID=2763258 RepID=UPI001CBF5D83|nr:hypothetical protein [Kangiella shandongensis]